MTISFQIKDKLYKRKVIGSTFNEYVVRFKGIKITVHPKFVVKSSAKR